MSTQDMKERLSVRMSAKRLQKLRAVAQERDKTMTDLIEDWIDRLPTPATAPPPEPPE
ncbi:MAG: hypothetical protein ACRC62_15405 [Microcoleus sp.]